MTFMRPKQEQAIYSQPAAGVTTPTCIESDSADDKIDPEVNCIHARHCIPFQALT